MSSEHKATSRPSAKAGAVGLLPIAIMVLALALAASPASAAQRRLFSGSFGAAASAPANPYPLSSGWFGSSSVAVDNATGEVYVTDQGNRRIEKFTPGGGFILMFGKAVNLTKVTEAAPQAQQNLCTAASGDTCQAGARASSPGAFDPADVGGSSEQSEAGESAQLFVAVDNSSGPSKGDVYVADTSDGLITKFDPSDKLVESWGDNGPGGSPNGQLNGSGATGPIQGFYAIFEGIATDSSGNLWVAHGGPDFNSQGAVAEFGQDASFITDWSTGEAFNGFNLQDSRAGIALDSLDNVYALPNKYDAAGHRIGRILEEGNGVAVDPSSNELYIAEWRTARGVVIQRFDASCRPFENAAFCTPVESFGAGHFSASFLQRTHGLAINPVGAADTVYAAEQRGEVAAFSIETVPDVLTAEASGFTASSAILNGIVNPAGVALSECFFEWGQSGGPYEHTAQCEPNAAAVGSGASPVPVHAGVSALQPGKTYHFRLVAANANDVNGLIDEPSLGADQTFGPPLLEDSSAAAVSSTAATLQADADANGVDTSLRFEYGTEAGVYDHVTATIDIGSASAFQSVAQPIQRLQPLTTYHYRVILQNTFGTVEGEDNSFTTQGSASPGLPDGRGWEMVSPPDKNGVPLEAIGGGNEVGGVTQAAADGSGLAYFSRGAIDSEPAGNRAFADTQLLAHRGSSGWSTQDIATPHQAPVGLFAVSEYELFSTDLSRAALEPDGATPLSPEATERTPYLRQPDGAYTPLVTDGNVPPGTKFGGEEHAPETFGVSGVQFRTGTPDLSHLLLSSPLVLTSPNFNLPPPGAAVYEWSAGNLSLVSQIPTGGATACGGAGPACVAAHAQAGLENRLMRHAMSTDGSRVIFTAQVNGGFHLFMRDLTRGETVQLDAQAPGAEGGEAFPQLEDASIDGSRVFFTDPSKLTTDAKGLQSAADLYMCEIGEAAGHLACDLKDLSVDPHPHGHDNVLDTIVGSSPDGSVVYFVANAQLAAGAVVGTCEETTTEATTRSASCNLYSVKTATREVKLVAVLSGADAPDWGGPGVVGFLPHLTARVSPNGRFLAFMSSRSPTGYDNRDARSGKPDQEVYLYDSQSDTLHCASCNPTGARPNGIAEHSPAFPPFPLVDRPHVWTGQTLAASVPGWSARSEQHALYQSRYLSDSGRLFFNAADPLVPQDSNGTEDVYQYEPPGLGTCTEESPTYGKVSGGCVGLISSGASVEESAFLDASESGDDVFFLTSVQLSHRDVDNALDVYDARVGGGETQAPPPPSCEGDACQSPVQPPNDLAPGSLTFSGPGNVFSEVKPPPVAKKTVKCRKPKKLRHGKCVKPKKKAKKSKKAKRATSHGRARR